MPTYMKMTAVAGLMILILSIFSSCKPAVDLDQPGDRGDGDAESNASLPPPSALPPPSPIPGGTPPPAPTPGGEGDQSSQQLLETLGCSWDIEWDAYNCDEIPNFGEYQWYHSDLDQFAADVGIVVGKIPKFEEEYDAYIQGYADSEPIPEQKFKKWVNLKEETKVASQDLAHRFLSTCSGEVTGDISNSDLAFLRACMVYVALQPKLTNKVNYFAARAYRPEDGKYGGKYRSVKFFLRHRQNYGAGQ